MEAWLKRLSALFTLLVLLLATFSPMTMAVALASSSPIPETDESPLALKKGALAQVDIINGSGVDKLLLDQIRCNLESSIECDFWDAYHARSISVFTSDTSTIMLLRSTKAYCNASYPDHQAAVSAVTMIAQSDQKLANIEISDASNASSKVSSYFTRSLMNISIRQGQNDLGSAEYYTQNGNLAMAVSLYGSAWLDGNMALSMADQAITPAVTITSPANGLYTNQSQAEVSGTVDDAMVYIIKNVTVVTNGKTYRPALSGGSFSQQVPLLEGLNTIKVTAKDSCLKTGTATTTVYRDSSMPAIKITGVSNGKFYNSSVQPIINISDANLDSSSVTLDGAPYTGAEISEEGSHVLQTDAVDRAGNSANSTLYFVVDRTAPIVTIYGVQPDSYLGKAVLMNGLVADANPDSISLKIDGIEVCGTLPYLWDTSAYTDGNHTLTLDAVDKAGNTGSASLNVVVDNTPPGVEFTSPGNGSIFSIGAIDFLWSGSDNYGIAFFELLVDQTQTYVITGIGQSISNLADGQHEAVVTAYDLANNAAYDNLSIVVDTLPPVINITGVAEGGYYRNATPALNVSDANLNFSRSTLNGMPYSGEEIAVEGAYTLAVYAEDLAGNNAATQVGFTVDTTPPRLAVNEASKNPNVLNFTYVLNGTVEEGAVLEINGQSIDHDGSFEYLLNLSIGVNTVLVTATDPAGNVAVWNMTRLIDEDLLPDYYETGVLGTDPLCLDSDSSLTAANEGNNSLPDDAEDLDGDGLANLIELLIYTNPLKADSDNDSLPDDFELETLKTSPIVLDTDSDTVGDADEDLDADGLSNFEEYSSTTNPLARDTDGDSLTDGDEVHLYHTNPLTVDTDTDGLHDDVEVRLGTNALVSDTDGNGVPDGSDSFDQEFFNASLGVTISIRGSGDLQKSMKIEEDASPYEPLTRLSGIASDFVEVDTSSRFDSAVIRLYYNESKAGLNESNIKLYYFDEVLGIPVAAANQTINTAENYVEATMTHFCTVCALNDENWAGESSVEWRHAENALSAGDRINISAQVHNNGSVDINRSVLVNFYNGDPSASGIYIGNATIPDGIPSGGSGIARLCNYTINSTSDAIYVEVDPLNEVTELDELNNKAFKLFSGDLDSDGDGLTDAEETNGMRVQYPYPAVYSDPYEEYSDEDSLNDLAEMGEIAYDTNGQPYYQMVSYPLDEDSDDDGLYDSEEVLGTNTVYVADTFESATSFWKAIDEGSDSTVYLIGKQAFSKPLEQHSDADGIPDGEEILQGTLPMSADSDNDRILDNTEVSVNEDATVFDVTPPEILSSNVEVGKESLSLNWKYHVMYSVSDYGCLKDVALVKNDVPRISHSFAEGEVVSFGESAYFETGDVEGAVDALRTSTVYVQKSDWNGNGDSALIYRRSSMYGLAASSLGSDTIENDAIAASLGLLSGGSNALADTPSLVLQIWGDPSGYLAGMQELADALKSDPALLASMIASLPGSVQSMQELDNPYPQDTQRHESYAYSWYTGYIAMGIAKEAASGGGMTGVKTAQEFTDLSKKVVGKMDDLKPYSKAAIAGLAGKVAINIAEKSPKAAKSVEKIPTVAKKSVVAKEYGELSETTKVAISNYESEVGEMMASTLTPGDAANLLNSMDGTTINTLFKNKIEGVTPELQRNMRISIAKAWSNGVPDSDIKEFTCTLDTLSTRNNVYGMRNIVKKMSDSKSASNFYGVAGEAKAALDYSEEPGNLVELTIENARYDIKVTNAQGIEYIEVKKMSPKGTFNDVKLYRKMLEAQEKFSAQDIDYSDGTTVLHIDATEGSINLKNDLLTEVNTAMAKLSTDQNVDPALRQQNYIGKVMIVLPDKEVVLIKDGNQFKLL